MDGSLDPILVSNRSIYVFTEFLRLLYTHTTAGSRCLLLFILLRYVNYSVLILFPHVSIRFFLSACIRRTFQDGSCLERYFIAFEAESRGVAWRRTRGRAPWKREILEHFSCKLGDM